MMKNAENKLVTLAIRTAQRAERIKRVLDEEGIDTVIHSLNLDMPDFSVGLRIRIHESDLPRALQIVEEVEKAWEQEKRLTSHEQNIVLVPIDFADFVHKTINFAFDFAKKLTAELVFLHVYYIPPYSISSEKDRNTYSLGRTEATRRTLLLAETDKRNFSELIKKRIADKELPDIKFRFELREGVAEDEILEYCRYRRPRLVVMGTQGKKISEHVIGSVTGEVLESCLSPVFAVPIKLSLQNAADINRVAFLTDFDQKDLIAIDNTLTLLGEKPLEVFFLHVAEKNEAWNEILLGGIKNYFATHYPYLTAHYEIITATRHTKVVSDYLAERNIDLLAFNTRRRNFFSRLFNPSLAYKMVLKADTPLFVTHI